jgi:hypothetical protein
MMRIAHSASLVLAVIVASACENHKQRVADGGANARDTVRAVDTVGALKETLHTVAPASASGPSFARIESEPPGAQIEIGIQSVRDAASNYIVTPGTGRLVGFTPMMVELRPSDINDPENRPGGIIHVQSQAWLSGSHWWHFFG